jgi:hypothetical protein
VTGGRTSRPTWSRLVIALSIGLIAVGVADATLPRSHAADAGPQSSPRAHPGRGAKDGTAKLLRAQEDIAAQRAAEQFVVATGTTDTTHPEGDTGVEALLAPHLAVPRLSWPEAWLAEHRRTTVTLDPPGPVIAAGNGQVAVLITGRIVVSTDDGPPSDVPVDERITLRQIPSGGSRPGVEITGVGTGS